MPAAQVVDDLLATVPPPLQARTEASNVRRYPRADDARHLASLVRAGRDPIATRWWRGMVTAVAAGAVIGAAVNGVLAGAFGMLGGLPEVAIPLGFFVGAFLGAFTAAMTGTEVPRWELRALWPHVRAGDVLVQWSGDDPEALTALRAHLDARGLPCILVTEGGG